MSLKNVQYFRYLLILGLFISNVCVVAQAWEDDDLQHWTSKKTETLEWGESFSNDIYKVEAFDFPKTDRKGQISSRYVGINLYENDELVADYVLEEWDSVIYNGDVKITCDYLPVNSSIVWQNDTYDPEAKMTIWLRGRPDLDIDVQTDKDNDKNSFKLTDSRIPVTINIKNEGDAPLEDVDLYVDTGGLEFDFFSTNKTTHYTYEKIDDDASISEISFELTIPSHMKNTLYNISVNVKGIDEKDEMHNFSANKEITVLNMINITKTIKKSIFMGDTAFVQLTIRNDGKYAVYNIEMKDTMADYFELIGSSPLQWTFDLGPGQYKNYQYTIKPVKPDKKGYKLPKANARWEAGGIEYNQTCIAPVIIVHGSKILLEKTVSSKNVAVNGNVTVTVTATNVGDVKASVEIFDDSPLPDHVTLMSGELKTKHILAEEDSFSLSYVVSSDSEGMYTLPKAKARFVDLQGYHSEEISDAPEFTVGDPVIHAASAENPHPVQTATPTPAPTRQQPGFEILSGSISLVLAVLLALRKRV